VQTPIITQGTPPHTQMEAGLEPGGKSSLMMLPTYVTQLPTG
jgi:hypothetical protein